MTTNEDLIAEHSRTSCKVGEAVNAEPSGNGCLRCNEVYFEKAKAAFAENARLRLEHYQQRDRLWIASLLRTLDLDDVAKFLADFNASRPEDTQGYWSCLKCWGKNITGKEHGNCNYHAYWIEPRKGAGKFEATPPPSEKEST